MNTLPKSILEPAVEMSSRDIASHRYDEFYVVHPLVTATGEDLDVMAMTNVFMIPAESQPRLRRLEVRDTANNGEAAEHRDFASALLIRLMRAKANTSATTWPLVNQVERACRSLAADESVVAKPFRTIGLLAVYQSEAGPQPVIFADRTFVAAHGGESEEALGAVAVLLTPRSGVSPLIQRQLFE